MRDLAVFPGDGDDGTVIGAAYVIAGNADEDVGNVNAGHPLGLLGCRFDRFDRLLEVDDDALAHPQRRCFADADDFETTRGFDRDDRAGLGRPNIEPANGLGLHPCVTCPARCRLKKVLNHDILWPS